MHHLIYVSSASHLMSDVELKDLLVTCRTRNTADSITGMLLYKDGSFMQLLEGEEDRILQTYERIGRDRRHSGLITLREGPLVERNCQGWSMGFRSVNSAELESLPGFARLGHQTFTSPAFTEKPHIAIKMLNTFHRTTR
jgi:hypothetical protein